MFDCRRLCYPFSCGEHLSRHVGTGPSGRSDHCHGRKNQNAKTLPKALPKALRFAKGFRRFEICFGFSRLGSYFLFSFGYQARADVGRMDASFTQQSCANAKAFESGNPRLGRTPLMMALKKAWLGTGKIAKPIEFS